MNSMLIFVAHPDDESFSMGGTIARYAKNGCYIHLVVATNGEKGDSGDFHESDEQSLGLIRQEEAKKAGRILGIEKIDFLNLPDLGLRQLTPGTLEDPLYDFMENELPDVVITHDPTGITNHPDHIKMCYAVTYAFQKYAARLSQIKNIGETLRGRGKIWKQDEYMRAFGDTHTLSKEPKLYYSCMPQSSIQFLLKEKQIPDMSFGKPWKGTPDKDITTIIDIVDTQLIKGRALLCHRTQMKNVDRYLSFIKNPGVFQEWFVLRMQGIFEVYMGKNDSYTQEL